MATGTTGIRGTQARGIGGDATRPLPSAIDAIARTRRSVSRATKYASNWRSLHERAPLAEARDEDSRCFDAAFVLVRMIELGLAMIQSFSESVDGDDYDAPDRNRVDRFKSQKISANPNICMRGRHAPS